MLDDHEFFPPFRYWTRHMAVVPKGFLRHQVLELLNERPLSGSEIMREIGERTGGMWRPSPGSVYPLLAWLQDNSYIREVQPQEAGVKRYTLTDKGRQLLEEQRKLRGHLERMWGMLAHSPLGALWLRLSPKEAEELRGAVGRLVKAFLSLAKDLEAKFSEEALKEAVRTLREAAERLEEVDERLRGGGRG